MSQHAVDGDPDLRPPRPGMSTVFRVVLFGTVLLLALFLVGRRSRALHAEVADLEQRLSEENKRAQFLIRVRQEVETLQKLKHDVEMRLRVTEELINNRASPVDAMTAVGKVLAQDPDVSLQSLEFQGRRVAVYGQARSADAQDRFRNALEHTAGLSCSPIPAPGKNSNEREAGSSLALECVVPSPVTTPAQSESGPPRSDSRRSLRSGSRGSTS